MQKYNIEIVNPKTLELYEFKAILQHKSADFAELIVPTPPEFSINPEHPDYTEIAICRGCKRVSVTEYIWDSGDELFMPAYEIDREWEGELRSPITRVE